MMKGKVMGFVKEHKKDIIHIAVTGAIGVVISSYLDQWKSR